MIKLFSVDAFLDISFNSFDFVFGNGLGMMVGKNIHNEVMSSFGKGLGTFCLPGFVDGAVGNITFPKFAAEMFHGVGMTQEVAAV
mgnify:FL=1